MGKSCTGAGAGALIGPGAGPGVMRILIIQIFLMTVSW